MTDSSDPLVAAAVHSLKGDAEMRSSATRLLESLREECPGQTEAALKRWNSPVGEKRRLSRRVAFGLTIAVISILLLTFAAFDLRNYARYYQLSTGSGFEETSALLDTSHFSGREKLLLKVGDGHESPLELAKALWDSDLTNPAYFSEYCAAYISEHAKLPPDFLEQARRIDPDNAYFPYWAAAVNAKDAAKQQSPTKPMKAAGTTPGWIVADEAKLDQALQVLHDARNLPDYRNYEVQLARERISLLPQNTLREYFNSVSLLVEVTTTHYYSRDLPNVIAAKAWLCGERGDPQGLIALKETADVYLRNICCTVPGLIIQNIVIDVSARTILKSLAASALKLGLTGEAAEIQARLARFEKLIADRKAGTFTIEGKDPHGSLGATGSNIPSLAKYALHPPVLTDRDVEPGRMIEHGVLWQICTYGTWALLAIVAALVALYRFRSPRVIRGLSARMELLLRPADWAWLCMAGIPPLVYCLLIIHLTPWGGSQANILAGVIDLPYFGGVLLPMAQFVGLFLIMLILPILITRWRLGKRGAFFGFGKARVWIGILALVSAAAAIPVLGWGVTRDSAVALKISWGLFVIPIGWILAVVIRAMTAGVNHLLHLTTAARVLVPAYSAAMVVLLLATPFFMMSRQGWFEQDTMNRLDAAYPSLTKFEYELSFAARKELREALGYE